MFDNLFGTQANTQQNSFSNPLNAANLNPGWGIDPNLLTPSYEASYRPQYSGPQPYANYGNPSLLRSIGSSYGMDPDRWGNPIDGDRQSIESMSSKPFDSVAWVGHRVAMPVIGYGLAFGALTKPSAALGRGIGQGMARGFTSAFGGNFARADSRMASWATKASSYGAAAGEDAGMLARSASFAGRIGAGGMTGMLAGTLGGAAGLAAGFILPAIAGQAALEGMQRSFINPYINTRAQARDLRDNFKGVTFGDSTGNRVSGQGLGGGESARIATDLTNQGIRDTMFTTGEAKNISDYSARSGLLDDAKSKQIAQRVKDITEQVKLVMALGSDPSIQNAIEELAKLHQAGASVIGGRHSVAATTYSNMSQYASIAGRSVQNVMNTVGAQGQYLYQANGMTPYLGQLAAGNILGSFESARRQGILNTAQVARMGGTEGATQASLTGQLNATQTLYSQMGLMNKWLYGGKGGSTSGPGQNMTSTIATIGNRISGDPMGVEGDRILFGRQLGGKEMEENGSLAAEDQAYGFMKTMPFKKNSAGQYSAGQLASVLVHMEGMSEDQATAYIAQRSAETNPDVFHQKSQAMRADGAKYQREYITQHEMYGGNFGRAYRKTLDVGRNITQAIAGIPEQFAQESGIFGDSIQGSVDKWRYGSTLDGGQVVKNVDEFVGEQNISKDRQSQKVKLINVSDTGADMGVGEGFQAIGRGFHNLWNGDVLTRGQSMTALKKINELVKSGDKYAIAFTGAKNKDERKKALGDLLANRGDALGDVAGKISGHDRSENFQQFLTDSFTEKAIDFTTTPDGTRGDFQKSLDKVTGGKLDLLDSMKAVGEIGSLAQMSLDNSLNEGNVNDILSKDRYKEVRNSLQGLSDADKIKRITDSQRMASKEGVSAIGGLAYNANIDLEKLKKDPSSIRNESTRKKFIAAKTDAEKKNILAGEVINSNDGQIKTAGLQSADKISLEEVMGSEAKNSEIANMNSKNYSALQSGKYDYATFQNTQNALDLDKSVDKFDKVVDKFDKSVQKMNGGSSSGPVATNLYDVIFNGKSMGDNKKDGGPQLGKK